MKDFLKQNFSDFRLMFRYGVSGVIGIISNLATIYAATNFFHLYYLWSAVVAFGVSLAVTFTLQKYWTFENATGSARVHRELVNYFLIAIVGNLIAILLLYIFTSIFGIWYLFSQVISLGIVAVASFIINKNHTFQNKETVA